MRPSWYGRDTELTVRMFITMFLLFAVYLGFLAVLWSAGVDYVTLAVIAVLLAGVQYYFSDQMVLWSMGARVVSPEEAPSCTAPLTGWWRWPTCPSLRWLSSTPRCPTPSPRGATPTMRWWQLPGG